MESAMAGPPAGPAGRDGASPQVVEAARGRTFPAGAPQDAPQTELPSLFDSLTNSFKPVTTTILVRSMDVSVGLSGLPPLRAGSADILLSAGTFGDISRYMQVFPGVVATSDTSNQMLVRGGHPMENLFLVDGIEIPNINHLSDSNSSGGLGPMIDAAATQGLEFRSSAVTARFPERLSSLTEIRTLDSPAQSIRLEGDLGIQGMGGLVDKQMLGGDVLVSAHHGLLNLVSSDVGLNGVPSYTNELTRFRRADSAGNHLSLLSVVGQDSLDVTPCASDMDETSTIESQYSGWRQTTGVEWQHFYTRHSFGVVNASDSEQIEHIHQQDQVPTPNVVTAVRIACPLPAGTVQTLPIYSEDSNGAFTTAGYRYEWTDHQFAITAGASGWLQRPHYNVAQPNGTFSPYSADPGRHDSTTFRSDFSTGETGTYLQLSARPLRPLSLSVGGRLQTFAYGGHATLTPRASAQYQLSEFASLHAAFGRYEQLPPYVYLLAYPQNHSLAPMRSTHVTAGIDLNVAGANTIRLEVYRKSYAAIPAVTEYPSVTIHSMVDMLGDQFVWLPMNSGGWGRADGIELSDSSRFGSRVQLQGSIAYSRTKFAGIDGVLRPSNFDLPWIANLNQIWRIKKGITVSSRFGFATGRPYTPFDMTASFTQNRPIYDLAQVNALRAPFYARLDVQVHKEIMMGNVHWELYGGVDNVLNRSNFLSYVWRVRRRTEKPVGVLWQTPIFPNFGVRVIFK